MKRDRANGRSHVRRAEAGFTLVELLVAMALVGLLSVLIFSGMRFGARSWDKSNAHLGGADDVRIAQELLGRTVGEAYPMFLTANPTDPHVEFDGANNQMDFLAPPPAAFAMGGLARFRFSAVRKGKTVQLVVAIETELARGGSPSAVDREVVLTGMKALSFSYFGATHRGGAETWHDRWADAKLLPKLIKISGGFFDNDSRIWPEMFVPTHVDMDVSCVFDPLTRYCRGRG
jgi:general secretion pathway protein J